MLTWLVGVVLALFVSVLLKSFFDFIFPAAGKLPPGPFTFPIIGDFLWLKSSLLSGIEPVVRSLCDKYGPIITVRVGSRPVVFIRDRALAHWTLIQNGAVFADRPPQLLTGRITTSDQHVVSAAGYGPNWRLLRRNLTSEILHPSRVGSYSKARKWVLEVLLGRLESRAGSVGSVKVYDDFQYAMFCLLVLMCFGDKLDEKQIGEIESIQRRLLIRSNGFGVLDFWPSISKILFRNRWLELLEIREAQESVYFPLIRARREMKRRREKSRVAAGDEFVLSYVDTLLDLELPEDNRSVTDSEIVSLCSEFFIAGTDTTSTSLQWIMANLVKNREIQEKLFLAIKSAMDDSESREEVREEDLQSIPYLKAVVLEGLRRHPPGHVVLPHAVTRDVEVEGYMVPREGSVNYMVADMGWDPEVWAEPMEFRPERFMSLDGKRLEPFDVTGSKEIKMMPFGAGRRICPGYGLAMLHLEYFVANLVWKYVWTAVAGEEVDLSEKVEFTVVMKYPLNACISPRSK